jgi:hypothetical protein
MGIQTSNFFNNLGGCASFQYMAESHALVSTDHEKQQPIDQGKGCSSPVLILHKEKV